jgi:hypothetical protein
MQIWAQISLTTHTWRLLGLLLKIAYATRQAPNLRSTDCGEVELLLERLPLWLWMAGAQSAVLGLFLRNHLSPRKSGLPATNELLRYFRASAASLGKRKGCGPPLAGMQRIRRPLLALMPLACAPPSPVPKPFGKLSTNACLCRLSPSRPDLSRYLRHPTSCCTQDASRRALGPDPIGLMLWSTGHCDHYHDCHINH